MLKAKDMPAIIGIGIVLAISIGSIVAFLSAVVILFKAAFI